jgi:hypothetical protein
MGGPGLWNTRSGMSELYFFQIVALLSYHLLHPIELLFNTPRVSLELHQEKLFIL